MDTYTNGMLYTGNIIKNINGEKIIAKRNAFLIYSKNDDCFYTLDVLNYLLDLETNKNLTDIQKQEYQKIVDANKYQYKNSNENERVYIDESTLHFALSEDTNKIRH